MIIDCIFDRYEGSDYIAKEFYNDMLMYGGSGIQISKAMDYGTEEDIKKELCSYVVGNNYNNKIINFINKANWLVDEKGKNWKDIISILD